MTTLELDVRARVADARVLDRHACTALLVSDPLELRRAATLFERSERPKEDTDRMAPADGILGAREVVPELLVRLAGTKWGEREELHRLVIERRDGRVNRVRR